MNLTQKHWSHKYIGKPYVLGGQYDCWTLFREIQENEFHITVPLLGSESVDKWKAIEFSKRKEGCAILLTRGKLPHHIGIWIDQDLGGIIHAVDKLGVIFTPGDKIRANRWKIFGTYKYVV